jgi:hypothetical protein
MVTKGRAPRPQQAQPSTARRRPDPKPRHIDGSAPWSKLADKDSDRHYVYAYIADHDCGLQYYLSIGYEVETYKRGGVRPAPISRQVADSRDGQEIEMRGMTLVSCSGERYEEIRQYGPDGQSGYELANELASRITARSGGVERYDEFSALIRSKRFGVANDTEDQEVFVEQ